jgi:hypothetical protein
MHRQRCGEGGDGRFWPVACRHEQRAALNHASKPLGWTLMHDVPSAGPFSKAQREHASWRFREGLAGSRKHPARIALAAARAAISSSAAPHSPRGSKAVEARTARRRPAVKRSLRWEQNRTRRAPLRLLASAQTSRSRNLARRSADRIWFWLQFTAKVCSASVLPFQDHPSVQSPETWR